MSILSSCPTCGALEGFPHTRSDCINPAPSITPMTKAEPDVVEAIAQRIEGWNGNTAEGDTFLIAAAIRHEFAALSTPKVEIEGLADRADDLLSNAIPAADDDERDLIEYTRARNAVLSALQSEPDELLREQLLYKAETQARTMFEPSDKSYPREVAMRYAALSRLEGESVE